MKTIEELLEEAKQVDHEDEYIVTMLVFNRSLPPEELELVEDYLRTQGGCK